MKNNEYNNETKWIRCYFDDFWWGRNQDLGLKEWNSESENPNILEMKIETRRKKRGMERRRRRRADLRRRIGAGDGRGLNWRKKWKKRRVSTKQLIDLQGDANICVCVFFSLSFFYSIFFASFFFFIVWRIYIFVSTNFLWLSCVPRLERQIYRLSCDVTNCCDLLVQY
jgi:hypothetical protein